MFDGFWVNIYIDSKVLPNKPFGLNIKMQMRDLIRIVEGFDDASVHPATLFHHSPSTNRDSIAQHGLAQRFDQTGDEYSMPAIYLTTTYKNSDYGSDVWQVNVAGLELERDHDEHDSDGDWWAYYGGDIPTSRLKLIHS